MEQKGFDSNFFIGMFLIFGILIWVNLTQIPVENNSQDVISNKTDQIEKPQMTLDNTQIDRFEKNVLNDVSNFHHDEKIYSISNNLMIVKISNYGGSIKEVFLNEYYTHDSLPLKLVGDLDFNFSFFLEKEKMYTDKLLFQNVSQSENQISFQFDDQNQNSISFIYELFDNSYEVKFQVVTNEKSSYIEPDKLVWSQKINQLEKNIDNERNATTINYSFNNKSSKQLSLFKDAEKTIESPIWVANRQQFFSTIIASEESFSSALIESITPDDDSYVKELRSEFKIDYDTQNNNYLFNLYFVPNKYSLLSSFDKGFESLVPLGWGVFGWVNKFLVIPMFNFLENFGLNYGIIILIIAVVIKMILFLPTKSSYLSMAKMRVLKPEIDAINEKIEDPMQRQQAHMNLYRKTGVNPLGGCLPMLLQMPILIALFRFFPASIELRQQPFLWADDLSTYDSILDLGFSIPLYGDHISLFALLMTLATALQMVYSNQLSSSNAQMPQMKYVMYTMPVIFLFVMNNYSSALSYYYFLANLITFGQQALIRKSIDDKQLYAMLQANKKKPVQKSKFQQRLEELARKNQNR
jgi:YidC/Oxa1 family membrane protein insertase